MLAKPFTGRVSVLDSLMFLPKIKQYFNGPFPICMSVPGNGISYLLPFCSPASAWSRTTEMLVLFSVSGINILVLILISTELTEKCLEARAGMNYVRPKPS